MIGWPKKKRPAKSDAEAFPEPLPVGEVVETDWREWDDSVAFQDTFMSGFGADADSIPDSLTGDASAIVVEVGPEDTEHIDPTVAHPPAKT